MITFRRYTREDVPFLVDESVKHLKRSSYGSYFISREKMLDLLNGRVDDKNFLVVLAVENGAVVGGLCAGVYEYTFSRDVHGQDHLFYILPSVKALTRGRIATGLVARYVDFCKERGAREVHLTHVSGLEEESYRRLGFKLGFKHLGSIMTMEL